MLCLLAVARIGCIEVAASSGVDRPGGSHDDPWPPSTPTVQRADRHELDQSCGRDVCDMGHIALRPCGEGLHPSPTRKQH